jgi:uncharacterized protein (DUF1778 family)
MKVEKAKTKKIEIRVSEDDYIYLKIAAFSSGQTVSGLMRMIAQASINAAKVEVAKGKVNLEDFKTVFDD